MLEKHCSIHTRSKRLHVGSYSCMLTYVNDLLFDYDDNPVCDKMM